MYINTVSNSQNIKNKTTSTLHSNKNRLVNNVFKGSIKTEISRNQLKILLSQDIWAEKLAVKKPETPLEKEVLLEILQNRKFLDKFTKLNNEKYRLINEISTLNFLIDKDPSNSEIPKLKEKITSRGNLDSILSTLNKKIELELKKNKPAFDYIKNIEKIEDEYRKRKLINDSKMNKFWHQIMKNNINEENKYSTKNLINIIENDTTPAGSQNIQEVAKAHSKKSLLEKVSNLYEQYLRENIDVYEGRIYRYKSELSEHKEIMDLYNQAITKYPEIKKQFYKISEALENKFRYKIQQLNKIEVYPVGEIWKEMKIVEYDVKQLNNSINILTKQLEKNPDNKEILESIIKNKELIKDLQKKWLYGLEASMKLESVNRQQIAKAGKLADYNYLVGENKTRKRYQDAYNLFHENNYTIPEDKWSEIMGLE